MTDTNNSRLQLNLGENNGSITLDSLDELEEWLNNERESFAWMEKVRVTNNIIAKTKQELSQRINNLASIVTQTKEQEKQGQKPNMSDLIDRINQTYKTNQLFYSKGPLGQYIEEIREADNIAAGYAVRYTCGKGVVAGESKSLEGAFHILRFTNGGYDTVEPERRALGELSENWDKRLNELTDKYEELNTRNDNLSKKQERRLAAHKKNYKQLVKDGREQLEDIGRTYDEKMALQASVDYWTTKSGEHLWLSKVFGYVSLSVGIILTVILSVTAYRLLIDVTEASHGSIVAFFVLLFFSLWLVRVLVKLFLSNLHLYTDASERVVMMKTYLAMLRQDQGPKAEDRTLILQALFRPSQTGLLKEDSSPPHYLDFIDKVRP